MTTSIANSESKQVWIGIDPSKHKTGIAVLVNGSVEYYTTLDVWDVLRVRQLRSFLYDCNVVNVFNDVQISCEVSGHSKFSNFDVNRAAGMAIGYISSINLTTGPLSDRVRFWYPQQWRKLVFGTASKAILGITDWKQYARDWVAEKYNLAIVTDDEAEAICLATLCGDLGRTNETKMQKTGNKRQRRVATKTT